ncbi:MAG: TetR/AcrR family transcriptional regulator [Brevinematia bacterium]
MKDIRESKEKIIEAGIRLFAEKGFDGTSVDEISKLAGVNKAMIYYYFSSKEGLLLSIFKDSVEKFYSTIKDIDISRFDNFKDVLGYLVRKAIDYIDSNSLVVKIFLREDTRSEFWEVSVIDTISSIFDKIKLILMKKFSYLDIDLTIVEQMLFVNLIVGYLNFKDRLLRSEVDDEVKELIKERYISKVSRMIYLLITDKEGEDG